MTSIEGFFTIRAQSSMSYISQLSSPQALINANESFTYFDQWCSFCAGHRLQSSCTVQIEPQEKHEMEFDPVSMLECLQACLELTLLV